MHNVVTVEVWNSPLLPHSAPEHDIDARSSSIDSSVVGLLRCLRVCNSVDRVGISDSTMADEREMSGCDVWRRNHRDSE